MATPLVVSEVAKSFTMHLRDGIKLPVVNGVSFSVASGECVVLGGPSGIGKSSILKMIYGNYAVDAGQILVEHRAHRRSRHRRSAHRAGRAAPYARLCQPVPAHRAARGGARCRCRAAGRAGVARPRGAAKRRRPAGQAQPAASALAAAAGDLLRRRAAARQHRPRLHHRSPILLLDEPTASLDAKNRASSSA
jgi:alpha-D-ribose 1-methylphosphonate 5-triphosphate synthase subunit PhnL